MMTAEEIVKAIWELYEQAKKDKAEIWERSMKDDADPQDEFLRHLYMGECAACETLLGIIGEIEV